MLRRQEEKRAFFSPFFSLGTSECRLQPIAETRERQVALWKEEIVRHCREKAIVEVDLDEGGLEIFRNDRINRELSRESMQAFFQALVDEGRAEWLGSGTRKAKSLCMIFWRSMEGWQEEVERSIRQEGLVGEVVTFPEVNVEGITRTLLERVARRIESEGRGRFLEGGEGDDPALKLS